MKCVVENFACGTIVFETSKITYMRKKNFRALGRNSKDEYCIYIRFDSGDIEELKFYNEEEREKEWQRIMKCWRSDEIEVNGPLTAGD